jgi:hypothetical protein
MALHVFPQSKTASRSLPKETRRIISGAYGKPKKIPVINLLDGSVAGWVWGKPSEEGPFFTLNE